MSFEKCTGLGLTYLKRGSHQWLFLEANRLPVITVSQQLGAYLDEALFNKEYSRDVQFVLSRIKSKTLAFSLL